MKKLQNINCFLSSLFLIKNELKLRITNLYNILTLCFFVCLFVYLEKHIFIGTKNGSMLIDNYSRMTHISLGIQISIGVY